MPSTSPSPKPVPKPKPKLQASGDRRPHSGTRPLPARDRDARGSGNHDEEHVQAKPRARCNGSGPPRSRRVDHVPDEIGSPNGGVGAESCGVRVSVLGGVHAAARAEAGCVLQEDGGAREVADPHAHAPNREAVGRALR